MSIDLSSIEKPKYNHCYHSDLVEPKMAVVRVLAIGGFGENEKVVVETVSGAHVMVPLFRWGLDGYREQTIINNQTILQCPWTVGLFATVNSDLGEWTLVRLTDGITWSCPARMRWRDLVAWPAFERRRRGVTLLPFLPPVSPETPHPIPSWAANMKAAYPTGRSFLPQEKPKKGMLFALPWLSAPPMVARVVDVPDDSPAGECELEVRFGASQFHRIRVSNQDLLDWPIVGG
jgi:hypothetical protein